MREYLTAIRARIEAATEGPWKAEFSGGMGNCVIPHDARSTREAVCVTRPYRALFDAEFIAHARTDLPALLDTVEAVLALHRPCGIYDECDCPNLVEGVDGHVSVEDVGITCALMYRVCYECCTDDGYQREECSDHHEHWAGEKYLCPTMEAIGRVMSNE